MYPPLVRMALPVALIGLFLATQASRSLSAAEARPMQLDVDLTDTSRRILKVRLVIPAQPGNLSLHYPQWIPGKHRVFGPIDQLTGLRFSAGGKDLAWRRDPADVYRFDLTVPAGASEVAAEFQVATPQVAGTGHNSRIVVSPLVANLQWEQVVFYPAGRNAMEIPVSATLLLPEGWRQAGALAASPVAGDPHRLRFETVPLEILIDSPLFAGAHFASYDLTPAGGRPVRLNVFGDEAADIRASSQQVELHRKLVREVIAALGPPRYDRYEFLLGLTGTIGGIGLEHHRSSENTQPVEYFREPQSDVDGRDLLAHEMVHSWNGKYRRPARLWTPHYNTPMQGDLLWVYEGLTQYYGMILTARAGIWPEEFAREELAATLAAFDRKRPGRAWRSLEDTTAQPIIAARRPLSWVSAQRTEDYYMESVTLWLDVDTKLRELSGGARSLDDFSREFFAAPASRGWVSTYELADVVRSLNRVAAFDWAAFLRTRVTGLAQPLHEGFERAGYRLVFSDKPNAAIADLEKSGGNTDLSYSLGMVVSRENLISEVVWEGPAYKAGLTTNTTVVAVNGRAYSGALLKEAIRQAAAVGAPVELLVRNQDRFRTVSIDYRAGLQYPHLQRIEGRADGLQAVLAPRTAPVPAAASAD